MEAATTSKPKAQCPHCNRTVAVMKDGTFGKHNLVRWTPCEGSGQPTP